MRPGWMESYDHVILTVCFRIQATAMHVLEGCCRFPHLLTMPLAPSLGPLPRLVLPRTCCCTVSLPATRPCTIVRHRCWAPIPSSWARQLQRCCRLT